MKDTGDIETRMALWIWKIGINRKIANLKHYMPCILVYYQHVTESILYLKLCDPNNLTTIHSSTVQYHPGHFPLVTCLTVPVVPTKFVLFLFSADSL